MRLADQGQDILITPVWITQDAAGRYYISDHSSRDIKIYDADGDRVATLGGAGYGPAEFVSLDRSFLREDSLFAFDRAIGSVKILALPHGHAVRSVPILLSDGVPPLSVRGADSLLLAGSATHLVSDSPLLELQTSDGRRVASFFDRPKRLNASAYVRLFSYVLSDATEGIIYAALSFSDTVYAFDHHGVRLAASLIDEEEHLPRLTTDATPADDAIPQGDLRVMMGPIDGWRHVRRIVALPDRFVVMQVTPLDVDSFGMLGGGTVIIAYLTEHGHIRNVYRLQTDAELLGRDATGNALFLRYADSSYETYELLHLTLTIE